MSGLRAPSYHNYPGWVAALCLSLGLLALVWSAACRRRPPDVEVAPPTPPPSVHVSRPHGPAYRVDNGLGSPVA